MEVASTPIQQQQTQQRQTQQQSQAQQLQNPDLLAQKKVITTLTGCPFAHTTHSLSAGPNGPVLLQDRVLFEKIQHFVREKIPPRNVHALGTGAYGELTITNPDLYRFTCAKVFEMGRVTKLFARLSGIFTDEGEAETVRDPRGFALKFFTSEGNWDLLAINTPVFACRDAKIGPETVHAFKRDPQTGEWNSALSWNFVCEHPEALHQTLMLFTNRVGTPLSWRHMNAFGCNTFSFINTNRERFWVKFHLIAELGWKGMASHEAKLIAGEDPDWLSRDLREAIQQRRFPKWKFCFQMMPEAEGYNNPIAFDATKIWPHADYPLIDIGTIELNQNPIDYFAEVDQVAFSPLNVVPGIGFSPDKLLQGRLLIYDDAQTHRLGPNFKQIPINQPHGNLEAYRYDRNYVLHFGGSHQMEIRDQKRSVLQGSEPLIGIAAGLAAKGTESGGAGGFGGGIGKQVGDVDVGIGAGSQKTASSCYFEPPLVCDGPADFYTLPGEGSDKDLYAQCREFLKSIDQKEFPDLIENLAMNFCKINQTEYPDLIPKVIAHFQRIDKDFANWVKNRYQEMCSVDPITGKTEGQLTWMRLKKKLSGGEKEKGEEEKTGTL